MNAYVDASVLLRFVLRERDSLREWPQIDVGIASRLVQVECLRTLDRFRLAHGLDDHQIAVYREAVFGLAATLRIVEPTRAVLARAAQPMPVALGTLDAMHLATALLWQETRDADLTMATHDATLARAARASGLPVIGA